MNALVEWYYLNIKKKLINNKKNQEMLLQLLEIAGGNNIEILAEDLENQRNLDDDYQFEIFGDLFSHALILAEFSFSPKREAYIKAVKTFESLKQKDSRFGELFEISSYYEY